jgi:imidazolonepropionase-like amidohydrolase
MAHPNYCEEKPVRLLASAVALLLLVINPAHAQTTGRWTWLAGPTAGGSLVATVTARGEVASHFAYLDNGRGPKLQAQWHEGSDGVPDRWKITGTTTFGSKADEVYRRTRQKAHWKTVGDEGTASLPSGGNAAVPAPAYLPLVYTPDYLAALVRAALRHGNRLNLLPAGELRVATLESMSVTGAAGQALRLTLHAITGLGLTPSYLWLDPAGALFANLDMADGLYGVVREGWEATAPALAARQQAADEVLLAKLAGNAKHTYTQPLAFRHVQVFDSRRGTLSAPQTVIVFRGRISTLQPDTAPLPVDALTVDGTGQTLLPALFDLHTHGTPWSGALQLAGGVTTARDLGNDHDSILMQEARYDSGAWLGPRLWRAGFMDGQSPYTASGGKTVASLTEALDAVDFFAAHGYQQVKLYSSFSPEWVVPVAQRAHERGLRVSGHVPAFTSATRVITEGYDELNHLNMLFLNFVASPSEDTRTNARFTMVGERAWQLDLDSAPVQAFIQELARRGTVVDPTLACFEDSFNQAPGESSRVMAPVLDRLPATLRRSLLQPEMELTPAVLGHYRASWQKMLDLLVRLDRAGVPLVPGTDALEGFYLHRELELWVQAGIPAPRVLQHATLGSARVLRLEQSLGAVEAGYSADLVLVDGNPLQDISALRRMRMVMKAGAGYFPAQIYPALGLKPAVPAAEVQGTKP